MEEHFTYDHLNRLTGIWLNNQRTGWMDYDPYGRMTDKTTDNTLAFSDAVYNATAKPHAIDQADVNAGSFCEQAVTYTCFDKVKTVNQGNNTLEYTYGYDRQRIFLYEFVNNTERLKRYVGNCEFVFPPVEDVTAVKALTYLSGPIGVFAVVEKQGDEETLHYILKDHQGSWTVITDAEGNMEQELSYDAWGNLRNPNTWCVDKTIRPMFDRGYTGHEHLNAFGLINMNGRMYDPVMSSFLSVDRYVQQPDNSQGFNRYAYCMYNPLRYVDPSGWLMSRPYGSGTIPPNGAPNKQPVAIDGGYRLAVIDGILYGGCYGDVIVTATGIQSSGSIFEDYPLFSSDRGFGSYDIGGENMQTISEASNYGGGGLGAFWLSGNNTQSKNVSVIASSINYSMSAVSTLLGATSYSYKQPQNRAALTELGKSLSKAQKAKLATKYPEISPKGASALKYGKAATKGMHNMGNAIGIAGTVVEAIDIVLSGEIRASKAFDIVIGIACVISGPYGWIIGGVALVGDIGFYAYTGRTIGGNIDRLLDDKSFRFWKGVY